MHNASKSPSHVEESLLNGAKSPLHHQGKPGPGAASFLQLALCWGLLVACWSSSVEAQQSLFNVPSTTVTPHDEVFLQEQLNLGLVGGESNLTVDYGLGEVSGLGAFEVGMNVLHVDLYGSEQDDGANDFAVNGSWLTRLTPELHLQLGAQVGVGTALQNYVAFVWAWSTLRGELPDEWGALVVGAYTGTASSLGRGFPVGGLVGSELAIVRHTLSFMADILIGENDASVAVLGLVVFLPEDWQLSAGIQLPSPFTNNPIEAVFELTRSPTAAHTSHAQHAHPPHAQGVW